ncbi:methyl-accepting chemotaxis protein [Natrialbaceae archaeon A-CW2]|uniref:methyl-accepting chemotaxis protein n=1 Tax=Natronosalvus amylolyticus TaxID=2961994 RepID=UPI0020C9539A|nr:methyl-accepting chemotaxis protein [Natronosalvus amylolyticus]
MVGTFRKLVPKAIRRSYALKFGIVLLVIGLAIGLVGIAGTAQIESEVTENANEEAATGAQQEAEKLDAWIERNEWTTRMISQSAVVQDRDNEAIDRYLQNWHDELPEGTHHVHYVDLNRNEVTASTNEETVGTELAALNVPEGGDWIRSDLDADQVHLSDSYIDTTGESDEPVLAFVQLVGDQPDRVIIYTATLSSYANQFESAGTDTQLTFAVDDSGRVVMDDVGFDESDAFHAAYEPASTLEAANTGDRGSSQLDADPSGALALPGYSYPSSPYVVGYAQSEHTDWVVVVHTPTAEAYGFVEAVTQYGLYATGFGVFVIAIGGMVLGRNTATAIDRLTAKAKQMEDGDLDVEFDSPRVDNIGQLYDGFDSMQSQLRTQIQVAENARDEAEIAREQTESMNRHLEAKADEYSEVMQACADGDLTARMDVDSENEAMCAIATEFNAMVSDLESTTAAVKTFAEEVATASEQVTASSEEVRSASEQVTESVQEISDGADRQNDRLQSVTAEMSSLSTTTEQIAASSNQVADIAERTADAGERGREAAQVAIDGMNEIEDESADAVDAIEALEAEMAQIDELTEFITQVAEQTNMLALNANIEASRSDADDAGFSVVASEVKELAAETKDAAEDIEARLERIHEQTEHTASEVQLTSQRVTEHTDSVRQAADALEEIAGYAAETNTGVQEISAASQQQAASTQEVVAMVEEVATISQETTAESENVAAAAEEQTTALTEVSGSASELTTQASELSSALDRFETDTDFEGESQRSNDELAPKAPSDESDTDEVFEFAEPTNGDSTESDTV